MSCFNGTLVKPYFCCLRLCNTSCFLFGACIFGFAIEGPFLYFPFNTTIMQPIHHASIVYTPATRLAIPAGRLAVQPVQPGLEMRPAIRRSDIHKAKEREWKWWHVSQFIPTLYTSSSRSSRVVREEKEPNSV
jgi:hypothetical protein